MTEYREKHVVHNCLKTAYHSLRPLGRFVKDSHLSPYKEFFEKVLKRKLDSSELSNTEVEAYYLNKQTEAGFISDGETRLFAGNYGDPDVIEQLLSAVWEMQLAVPAHSSLCTMKNSESARQLWEIFIRLDTEGQLAVHIEDVCDLLLRIGRSNGHVEQPETVQSWFNNEQNIKFWPFFKVMTERYKQCLQTPVVMELFTLVSTEVIKEGKLTKKGHIMPNWKGRWFTLTTDSLSYREGKDTPILKTIVMNEKTQVQNMPHTKGHLYRFRVLDGVSTTPTEISATDEFTMREWMAFIRLAIKMHTTEGRNFLHKYRLAINTFPKSFFSQASAIPLFTAAPSLPQAKKSSTDPLHKGLRFTHSVPLGPTYNNQGSDNTLSTIAQGPDSLYDLIDGDESSEPPPLPPQQFSPTHLSSTDDAKIQSKYSPSRRRRSSLDSSEITHIQVDNDLEYAVVTKVKTKKKKSVPEMSSNSKPNESPKKSSPLVNAKAKSMDVPLPLLPPSSIPPPPPPHASTYNSAQHLTTKESPRGSNKPVTLDFPPSPVPPPRSPRSSPTPTRKGYAELQFDNGSVNTSKVSPVCDRRQLPPDAPNKFSYSKLNFDKDKEKEDELENGVKVSKKAPPPAPPRYQGQMMKNMTESSLQSPEHKAPKGRSKPNSLPSFNSEQKNLDYAEVVFSDNTKASPLIPHHILEESFEKPHQNDHPPPRSDGTVLYSTVIRTQTPPEEKKTDKVKDKPRPDGYENFDFNPNKGKKDDGYVNFDFTPGPPPSKRPGSAPHGPTVAGSARLLKNNGQPHAKPRALPRKVISTPTVKEERAPVPPERRISSNT